MPEKKVRVGSVEIGGGAPLAIICGPCVVESLAHARKMAAAISEIASKVGVPLIYKSSYTKANRTSASSFRGPGMEEGLSILATVRKEFNIPVVSDVHSEEEARSAAASVDLVQIPAFLCRQTQLLEAAGESGKPVMVKKGQFVAPADMKFAADKVRGEQKRRGHSEQVLLCERGACFGYRDLIVDFRSLRIMSEHAPVVFDATHSVQQMGGSSGTSGGFREFVPCLARAAVSVGVDAVFIECHDDPDRAPSDGPNMLPIDALAALLGDLKRLHELKLETRALEAR